MSRIIRRSTPIHLPPLVRTPRGLVRSWTPQPKVAPPRPMVDLGRPAWGLVNLVAFVLIAATTGLLVVALGNLVH